MLEYLSDDDPWTVRCAYRTGRYFNTPRRKALGFFLIILTVWLVFSVASAYAGDVFGAHEQIVIEHSAHFSYQLNDARAYTWLQRWNNGSYYIESEVNGSVSETVVAARHGVNYGQNVVLLRDTTCDASRAAEMSCADFSVLPSIKITPRQAEIVRMQYQSCRYLFNNLRTPCVCGPMLGFDYRYIAVRVSEEENDGDACLHLFNPSDQFKPYYDTLDAAALKERSVGLMTKAENENYRYNQSRGVYQVMRSTRTSIDYQTKQCKHAVYTTNALQQQQSIVGTQCVQYCLDKIDGIDVRERARMQYKQGVVLNRAYFAAVPDQPSCVFDPIGTIDASAKRLEIAHDEL